MRIQLERLSVEGEKAAKNSLSDFFTSTIRQRAAKRGRKPKALSGSGGGNSESSDAEKTCGLHEPHFHCHRSI
jgi:hypothetical protein